MYFKKNDKSNIKFKGRSKFQKYNSEVSHGIISVKSDVGVVLNQPIESWNNGDAFDSDLL